MEIINNPNDAEQWFKKIYFSRTGIFSTSIVSDSAPLWKWKQHHKQHCNGNAVCIALDLARIKEKLHNIGNYSLGLISYQNTQNEVDFVSFGNSFVVDRLNSITFTLPKNLVENISEQQELRIIKLLTIDISKNSSERFLFLDPEFIKEVIIHNNATDETKKEVEAIANKIQCSLRFSNY